MKNLVDFILFRTQDTEKCNHQVEAIQVMTIKGILEAANRPFHARILQKVLADLEIDLREEERCEFLSERLSSDLNDFVTSKGLVEAYRVA